MAKAKKPSALSVKVKDYIKEKFVTYARFARLTGEDQYELQKMFSAHYSNKPESVEKLNRIDKVAHDYDASAAASDIDQDKLQRLKKAIEDVGGLYQFCRDNSQFAQQNVYEIVTGERRFMSEGIQKLFDHFGIA